MGNCSSTRGEARYNNDTNRLWRGRRPVKAGIVQSLARPGTNVTGLSSLTLELEGKRIALLKEVAPTAVRIGVFTDPASVYSSLALKEEQRVASSLNVEIHPVVLRGTADL